MNRFINSTYILVLSLFLVLQSCDMGSGGSSITSNKPLAYGQINEIIVVADKDMWESRVGDTIIYYYQAPFLILPQPEPIFDVRHMTPEDLSEEPLRKQLRNYLIVADLSDLDSPTTQLVMREIGDENVRLSKEDPSANSKVAKGRWAQRQIVVYQYGWSEDELIDNLKNNFTAISKRIKQAQKDKYEASVYAAGQDKEIERIILEKMGAKVRIPKEYFMALEKEDAIWIRKETDVLSSSIIFHSVPYEDQSQLTKEGIKAVRDSIGRKYVSSSIEGTYMETNDRDLPMFTEAITLNGNYALENRGIWRMHNDFMGGPFISYLIHNKDKKELLFVDAFVYVPGKKKRPYMERLEYILQTIEY